MCLTSFGTMKLRIGMPSCIASSFSHGDAFVFIEPGTHDDPDILAAEPTRRAAAIHRGVAAAEHDHALEILDMAERDIRQPVDADVNVRGGFRAARHVEFATAGAPVPTKMAS